MISFSYETIRTCAKKHIKRHMKKCTVLQNQTGAKKITNPSKNGQENPKIRLIWIFEWSSFLWVKIRRAYQIFNLKSVQHQLFHICREKYRMATWDGNETWWHSILICNLFTRTHARTRCFFIIGVFFVRNVFEFFQRTMLYNIVFYSYCAQRKKEKDTHTSRIAIEGNRAIFFRYTIFIQ